MGHQLSVTAHWNWEPDENSGLCAACGNVVPKDWEEGMSKMEGGSFLVKFFR